MRGVADECNRPLRKNLDGTEAQAVLGGKLADQLAHPLAQIGRVRPADVLAAGALGCFFIPPRTGAEQPRLAAAKALHCAWLHDPVFGVAALRHVPRTRDAK